MINKVKGVYVILDPFVVRGSSLKVAEEVLAGGASVIQWRDKLRDKGDQIIECQQLRELCDHYEALFIINDHVDLAVATGADGVHLGQHDLPVTVARSLLGPDKIIGKSNALVDEALSAQSQGADYVAVGAIFPTQTKSNTRPAGLETLVDVRKIVSNPIVAIGGITEITAPIVIESGADAVAVITAILNSDDPRKATQRLVEKVNFALSMRE